MANGTIAFDTLTTSDSVNTGTEKSIDTSYIFNGVAKQWVDFNGSGTAAVQDSFNTASISDEGTGDYRVNLTNAMNAASGCINTGVGQERDGTIPTDNDLFICFVNTGQVRTNTRDSDQGSNEDSKMVCTSIMGDLA